MNKMFVPAALVLAFLSGCGNSGPTSPSNTTVGHFSVALTDAPASVQSVVVDVTSVLAHHAGAADDQGWEVVSSSPQAVDLLSYQNGAFFALADATLPVGGYDSFRLLLGTGCSLTVNGVTQALTVPSGAETGLKVNRDFTVASGSGTTLQVDFDVSQSLRQSGNGKWTLRPVMRVMPATQAGAIQGVVDASVSGVDLYQSGALISRVMPDAAGHFAFCVLASGDYNVVIHSSTGDVTKSGVAVASGASTDLGTISFAGGSGGGGGTGPRIIDL
jgi:predicted phage tail protein